TQRQLARVLVEVEERALLHAAHAPAPALPEIDLVQVELEDLLLGVAKLDQERQQRLVELAREGPLPREEDVLRQLLADGAPSFDQRSRAHVPRRGASDAQEVEPHVAEEATVLARHR